MKKILATILALCMMFALLTACGSTESAATSTAAASTAASAEAASDASASTESSGPKTIVYGTTDSYGAGFNPLSSVEAQGIFLKEIYDYLMILDPETMEVTSKVCDDWYWEEDGCTYYFHLKDGITYSNGAVMTAEDVYNSLVLEANAGNSHSSTFGVIDLDATYCDDDDMGIHIKFTTPYGPADCLLMNLAILDKDFCDQYPDGDEMWFENPVGSGPYAIADYAMDSYATLTKRADYWGEDIYEADTITVRYYSDTTTMMVDFQNGVINCALNIDSDSVAQVEDGTYSGTVVTLSSGDVPVLSMNEQSEAFQNEAVREAICIGVDWAAVANIAYGELAVPATSHLGSNYACYVAHDGYQFDADAAKQLLADAGYGEGDITLEFVCMNTSVAQRTAEAVQGYLGDIGITVNITSRDAGTALGIYMEGGYDFSLFSLTGMGATLEPYNALAVYSATGPFIGMKVSDSTYNSYLDEGTNNIDPEVRNAAYQKADDWLYDNYWAIPVCERLEAYAIDSTIASIDLPSVQGVTISHVHFA